MSSQVSPPVTGGQGIGSSTQPTTALPQTSAQETALPANGQAGSSKPLEGAVGSTGDATLGAPGQGSSAAPAGGDSAQRISENVERSSKRSLTGRRREGSMSSKRSARQVAGANEKATRPGSASRSNVAPTKKKKKGLLSFLNCCSAPDEAQELGATDSAQPAKTPAARSQATRAKPPQQASQAPTASATNTSTQDSKEIIDEKSAPQANHNMPAAAPILPSPLATDAEKPQQVVQPENPVPSIPPGTTSIQPNPETSPLQAERGGLEPEDPTTGPPHLDTSSKALETPAGAGASPQVNVIQPTPVVPHHQDEDGSAMILDRTPEQAELDTQIENTDNNPSLPLSTADVPAAAEGEQKERERRESEGSSRIGLPPPPPLAERQAQVNAPAVAGGLFAADATAQQQQSHENSVVSTPEPVQKWLLPPIKPEMKGRKCLVLDLDETLVHSSFKILHQADMTIPVEIEGQYHNVYVIKRPGVDAFLKRVGEIYEVVVFTASVSKYGDPLLDQLDISGSVHHRLFRESCYNHQGNYVKDLSQVGRPLEETIIIDNSPTSYIFHPQHAVPISSWFSDAHDNELSDLIPVLEDLANASVRDVSLVLDVAL